MAGRLDWARLSLDEARRHAAAWRGTRNARLVWLDEQLERRLTHDAEGIAAAWSWYRAWSRDPSGVEGEPLPTWWDESDEGLWTAGTPAQAIGADALGHLFEASLLARFPDMVHVHPGRGELKAPPEDMHRPTLSLSPTQERPAFDVVKAMWNWLSTAAEESYGRYHPHFVVRRFIESCEIFTQAQNAGRMDTASGAVARSELLTVEKWDDGDYRWVVEVDDVTANEQEALVERLASELGDAPGVAEAYHQDRGQILVSGTVTRRALTTWAREWWKENTANE